MVGGVAAPLRNRTCSPGQRGRTAQGAARCPRPRLRRRRRVQPTTRRCHMKGSVVRAAEAAGGTWADAPPAAPARRRRRRRPGRSSEASSRWIPSRGPGPDPHTPDRHGLTPTLARPDEWRSFPVGPRPSRVVRVPRGPWPACRHTGNTRKRPGWQRDALGYTGTVTSADRCGPQEHPHPLPEAAAPTRTNRGGGHR